MIAYLCHIDGGSSSSTDDGGSSSSTDDGESSSSSRLVCVKGLQALEEEERRLVSQRTSFPSVSGVCGGSRVEKRVKRCNSISATQCH